MPELLPSKIFGFGTASRLKRQARAIAALQDLEKAQIGTVHSFAAHLLRLYPLESGVDPAFREDDGAVRRTFSDGVGHLDRSGAEPAGDTAQALASATRIDDGRAASHTDFSLCSDLIDVEALTRQLEMESLPTLHSGSGMATRSQALLDAYDRPKRRKIEHMLAAAAMLMKRVQDGGPDAIAHLIRPNVLGLRKTCDHVSGEEHDFAEATSLIKLAKQLLLLDHHYFNKFLKLVSPFIESVRATFLDVGWVSFDGLLARARSLLWEHPNVREREYRAVLIDEFQDTDPLQYEIILAVSEEPGLSELAEHGARARQTFHRR